MAGQYSCANILFPEWFEYHDYISGFERDKKGISGDLVSFPWKEYLIQAHIGFDTFSIPGWILTKEVNEKLLEETIKSVTADIETIDAHLEELRKMSKKGRFNTHFYYEREHLKGRWFKFFDYSTNDRYGKPFEDLLQFKKLPRQFLNKRGAKLFDIASNVEKDGDKIPYVFGKTLKIATERALRIYKMAGEIKQITFD